MPENKCDIAFVTVNYNTCTLLQTMIDFFRATSLPFSHKLVVVDNNSDDGSQEFLTTQADILYIQAGENLGYGKAINRGIKSVESRYICVLNTDVVLNREALVRLREFMEQNPDAGVVTPRITNRDGSTQGFIFCKRTLAIVFNILNRIHTSWIKMKLARTSKQMRVDGVLGAFFLIRRSLAPDGTLFDEDFFFYFEDTDLAHRLFESGVECYVLPQVSIIHLGGSSTSIEAARIFFKSKKIYLTKHYGSVFARAIIALDRWRLRMKFIKYSFLHLFSSSGKIAGKKEYYASMQHALVFEERKL